MSAQWQQSADHLRQVAGGMEPELAIVLGSGLGALVHDIDAPVTVSYTDLPGFPRPTVQGHAGRLVMGRLAGVTVAVMLGRTHFYESGRGDGMETPIRALKALGCDRLILTNAAGSLRSEAGPGSLMLIDDHIALGGPGPLVGTGDPHRFVDMVDAYDPGLRARFMSAAAACDVALRRGVYMWFAGPNFETPAEIRAARTLGADAVGMSTVPEVIIARMLGLRVAALSVITNLGAGMASEPLSHEQTMREADRAATDLRKLMISFLEMQVDDR